MAKKNRKILVANWKMNGLVDQSLQHAKSLSASIQKSPANCDIVICPPFTLLRDMAEKIPSDNVYLGAQNCHHEDHGAFTGEISAKMLSGLTCKYVILGHSERRIHNNEGSEVVRKKAAAAIKENLTSIICVGETEYERDNDLAKIVIREQLLHSIPNDANSNNTIIAYEPVWAIGSGKTPSIEQIEATHSYIKETLSNELKQFEGNCKIIYGGSTNPDNAKSILSSPQVDGLLVGKASLNENDFWKMIESAA